MVHLWGFLILSNSISINEGDKFVRSVQFTFPDKYLEPAKIFHFI